MSRKVRTATRKSRNRTSTVDKHANGRNSQQGYFERFACYIAHLSGRPGAFLLAFATIIVWAVSGPVFGFSDTWQLVINTGTTIVTFLMVFLIQNSQNRDTTALQVKLDALIFANRGAKNKIAAAEHLSDSDLEKLHEEYHQRAEQTLAALHKRRPPAPGNGGRKAA